MLCCLMISCSPTVEIDSHNHENILPFSYAVDVENSHDGHTLNLTITTADKSIKYIPSIFNIDENVEDKFLGDLVLTTYEEISALEYKLTETEENYIIELKLDTYDKLDLMGDTYDLAIFVDSSGYVLEEFNEKYHVRGHILNGFTHYHTSIPE